MNRYRHLYVLRFEGDEAYEHHLGLLSDTALPPLHTLPPLYIYPHGITQVRVRFQRIEELQAIQTNQWERLSLFQEKVWQRLLSGQPSTTSSTPSSAFTSDGGKGLRTFAQDLQRALSETHTFLLVPCQNHARSTETTEEFNSKPGVDVHDELFVQNDDLIRDRLVLQSVRRMQDLELPDFHQVETGQQTSQDPLDTSTEGIPDEQSKSHFTSFDPSSTSTCLNSAQIAWDYVDEFIQECNFHTSILPIIAGYISSVPVTFYDSISMHEVLKTLGAPNSEREFVLETIYNGQLYLFVTISTSKTAHSPFPNKDYPSYLHYYQQKWPNFAISHPDLPLIRVANFQPGPLNVLVPSVLGERKKTMLAKREDEDNSSMYLLPDLVRVWRISSRFYQLLRMAPSILYRLDMDLRHQAFADGLQVKFNPSALRMALTTGNAQENYALKPMAPQPHPMPSEPPFNDGIPALMKNGASHAQMFASYPQQVVHSYERLKFMGDSLMKFLTSQYFLAIAEPDEDELSLTKKKSDCLSHAKLSRIAYKHKLHHVLVSEPFQPVEYAKKQLMGARWSDTADTSPWSYYSSASFSFFSSDANTNILADCVSSLMAAAWLSNDGRLSCVNLLLKLGIVDVTRMQKLPLFNWETPIHVEIDRLIQLQVHRLSVPDVSLCPPSESMEAVLQSQREIERRLGYRFNDPSLFLRAFVHDSWQHRDRVYVSKCANICNASPFYARYDPDAGNAPFPSMQRLEFLGDAVLDVCVSTYLFHTHPFAYMGASGDLTALRQRLVNNCLFAEICAEQGFYHLLLQSSEETRSNIEKYVKLGQSTMESMNAHGYVGPWYLARVRGIARNMLNNPPKILADLLESILGAVFVDSCCSFANVWKVFTSLIFTDVDWERHTYDEAYAKNTLQVYAKKAGVDLEEQTDDEADEDVEAYEAYAKYTSLRGYAKKLDSNAAPLLDGKKQLPHWDRPEEIALPMR